MTALELACSRYVGVVVHVDELLPGHADSALSHVVAVGALDDETGGAGYAASYAAARAAAIGEALERYAARHAPPELQVAAASDVRGAVAPSRFGLFAPEQHAESGFPFVPFTTETRVRWAPARSLVDGRRVLLPAQLVYLGRPDRTIEEPIAYATSSGLACAPSFAEAALAALLELLERDAFLITWRARLSLPLLELRDAGPLAAWERRYLSPAGLRHDVVDLSIFHRVPTALAVVRDAQGSLAVGAAASPTTDTACRKALAEAYAGHGAARRMRDAGELRRFSPDFREVVEFADHIRVYADPRNAERACFLSTSPERRTVGEVDALDDADPQDLLGTVTTSLLESGMEAYAVDVTTPDVAELGLHVVRVVVPELCPLDVRQDACFLGARRLREAPAALGLREHALTFAELNRDPHPFP